MKIKITIVAAIAMFISFFAYSQVKKVNTDKKHFSFEYLKAPRNIVYYERDSEHKYAIEGSFEPSFEVYFPAKKAEDAVYVMGWQKVWSDANPSVMVRFSATGISALPQVKERAEKQKDRNGREYMDYYYHAEINYNGGLMSYSVVEVNGQLIAQRLSDSYEDSFLHSYVGKEFRSRREAERDLQANMEPQRINAMQKWYNKIIATVSSFANDAIGWSIEKERVALLVMDEKLHPENSTNIEHYMSARRIIESIKARDDVSQLAGEFAPHIEYYKSMLDRYTKVNDKKIDQRLRALAYYNLAAIYFALEDYKTSSDYAIKYVANGYEKSSGKSILSKIDDVQKYFDKSHQTTLHPNIEIYE